jgi:hypothetical protein
MIIFKESVETNFYAAFMQCPDLGLAVHIVQCGGN